MMKNKKIYIILSVIICAFLMCFVDGVIKPHYFVKSAIKLVLFLVVPLFYFVCNKGEIGKFKSLFCVKPKTLLFAVLFGGATYIAIVGAYMLLRASFDFSTIAGKLTENAGVSKDNFLYVSLYISFINSLLEEFFFRGFAFITLKNFASRRFAYVFSAAAFALYHAGMTAGYYGIGVFVLLLAALFAAGVMFDYINEKSGSIYPSWLVHMFANFAINTVGFILFGMI